MIKSSVGAQSIHETLSSFIVLFVFGMFETLKGIRVCKMGIQLNGSLETFDSLIVFMLTGI